MATSKKPGEKTGKTARTTKTAQKTLKKPATKKAATTRKKTPKTAGQPSGPAKNSSMLRIEYYRSAIGLDKKQKNVVKGLGFRRLNAVRELQDSVEVRGMVAKIPHLVRIVGD